MAALFDEYVSPSRRRVDLDLFIFRSEDDELRRDELMGFSLSVTSRERVDVALPEGGRYVLVVHGYNTKGSEASYTLFSWVVGDDDQGNLTVDAPSQMVAGATAPIEFGWEGLTAGTKYLGAITYHNTANPASFSADKIGLTFVGVATD